MLQRGGSFERWNDWDSGRSGEREHIAMVRENPDGSRTPLTLPNHPRLKGSTLKTICAQAGIPRVAFLKAYESS